MLFCSNASVFTWDCVVQVISSVCVQILERKSNNGSSSSASSPLKPNSSRTLVAKARVLEDQAIRKARSEWELGINEELLAIAAEKDRPVATLM
jgi:hypothetical protein